MTEEFPEVPVKVFAAIIWAGNAPRHKVIATMEKEWGEVDYFSKKVPFNFTTYYAAEMGTELVRELISFQTLMSAAALPGLKHTAIAVEEQFLVDNKRCVNIDVGYLDFHKVVLASTKSGRHKIYMSEGIWADLTLMYREAEFTSFDWTFPDFKAGIYNSILEEIRQLYKKQIKESRF